MKANTLAAAIVEDGARLLGAKRRNHGSCWDRGCLSVLESESWGVGGETQSEPFASVSGLGCHRDVASARGFQLKTDFAL